MSAFNQKYTRVLQISPSLHNIPYPNLVLENISSGATGYQLMDNTVDFIEAGVSVGDIVFNDGGPGLSAKILDVSQNNLILTDDIFQNVNMPYKIYQGNDAAGLNNRGCTLLVTCSVLQGDSYGFLKVETIGGDIVDLVIDRSMLMSVPFIVPFQIKRLISDFSLNSNPSGGDYGFTYFAMW